MDAKKIVPTPETVNIRGRISIITPIGENMPNVRETSPAWKNGCRSKSPPHHKGSCTPLKPLAYF